MPPPPTPGAPDARPDVSIVIAAWNAEATLGAAIESALAQTVPVEVLVVDDASTDATGAIARAAADRDGRVRALASGTNGGPGAARNLALAHARAPWIAPLDADDSMAPGRLAVLIAIAEDEGADLVADDLHKVVRGAPDSAARRLVSDEAIGRQRLDAARFVTGNLTARHGGRREYGYLKPLMSRAFLERHGLRYPEIRLGEDYVLYCDALLHGARLVLTDPAGYRALERPGSLSDTHPTEAHAALIAADRAFLSRPGLDAATRAALRAHMLEARKKSAWRRMIDAVRERDARRAAACFLAPPGVVADLSGRLLREAWLRGRARAGLRNPAQ